MFDAVAFAGGGNRCYWQAGFWDAAAAHLGLAPRRVVGVSAGAWAACCNVLGEGHRAAELVAEGCGAGVRNMDWAAWRRREPLFPVAGMYRLLMETVVDEAAFERLRAGPEILIALARKPRRLPLALAIPLGIAAYQIEKKLHGPVHPRGGRALGFQSHVVRVQDMREPAELVDALMASASVPPFMPVGRVGGLAALDGGLVDNVPVEPLRDIEAAGGRTLVLLTRRYKAVPLVRHRTYVQPSRPIPVGQFDVTNPEGVRAAYRLGREDGAAFVSAAAAP
ncbi:patatin-like phospholipase family protein [Salinarimonas soli]|uniref:Patatin n=1 Tax=Salinarimonas soli TaxID=1638099 RepID=A0A5B2VBV5_9HYPH|nr:patatin-like phospholipase family protein [Salinarimonas soli]KAA2236238.1 patatin [Salinarimonas soli]